MESLYRIAIHGAPRSGTSWLGEIVNSSPQVVYRYQPLFSYAFKSYLNEQSDEETCHKFFGDIEKSEDRFICQTEQRNRGILPSFSKTKRTHVVYKEVRYHRVPIALLRNTSDVKVVFIVRDPRSVIASWCKAKREFREDLGWRLEEEWRYAEKKNMSKAEEFYGYEKWKESAKLFTELSRENPKRALLLKYNDLITDRLSIVQKIFEFCELPMDDQTLKFVKQEWTGNEKSDYSVFRRKDHQDRGWKNVLPISLVSEIEKDVNESGLSEYIS